MKLGRTLKLWVPWPGVEEKCLLHIFNFYWKEKFEAKTS